MEVGGYCSVERTMWVCSAMSALVLETVGNSLAFVLMMGPLGWPVNYLCLAFCFADFVFQYLGTNWNLLLAGWLLDDVRLIATDERFPVDELHKVKRPVPENKDSSDTEDDEDDEDNDNVDDEDDDDPGDEDFSGEEGDEGVDPEDDPEANGGGGGSNDDDDEDEDDDGGDDDDADEDGEEDEDEDEDEEVPQPPAKKRK